MSFIIFLNAASVSAAGNPVLPLIANARSCASSSFNCLAIPIILSRFSLVTGNLIGGITTFSDFARSLILSSPRRSFKFPNSILFIILSNCLYRGLFLIASDAACCAAAIAAPRGSLAMSANLFKRACADANAA